VAGETITTVIALHEPKNFARGPHFFITHAYPAIIGPDMGEQELSRNFPCNELRQ